MRIPFIGRRRAESTTPITEFYALTHPFHQGGPDVYDPNDYFEAWKHSITNAAQDQGVFAILHFSALLLQDVMALDTQLLRHARKMFGDHRVLLHRCDGVSTKGIFSEEVRDRIVDRRNTAVTGRGVFAFQCAKGVTEAACSAYNIPYENASLDLLESPDSRGDVLGNFHSRRRFPDIAERRRMQAGLSAADYDLWLDEALAEFEPSTRIASDRYGWEVNFGATRVKTYLGDPDFLESKFGDLRFDALDDGDWEDARWCKRLAITYQFLADPLSIYGINGQVSNDQMHINPALEHIDDPHPWQANVEEVMQFHGDLSLFLLDRISPNGQEELHKVIGRACQHGRFVYCID